MGQVQFGGVRNVGEVSGMGDSVDISSGRCWACAGELGAMSRGGAGSVVCSECGETAVEWRGSWRRLLPSVRNASGSGHHLQFGGSWHPSVSAAAAAWAATALPDESVVEADESAAVVAERLEAFWWDEAQKRGEGAPDDVDEDEWRSCCRTKLVERIERSRRAA